MCTNCSASSRKKPRQCVYDFDLVPVTPPASVPGTSTVTDSPGTSTTRLETHPHSLPHHEAPPPAHPYPAVHAHPPPTQAQAQTQTHVHARPQELPPPVVPTLPTLSAPSVSSSLMDPGSLPAASPSGPIAASLGHLTPQPVDVDRLARAVEDYGLTWFIEASEVAEAQFYFSDQRRAFGEYRQMVLARCWNAYIECHGKLLPDGLPGFSMLSMPVEIANPTPDVVNNLMQAALLHAFVAVGAVHLAYWSSKRGVASTEQHMSGALALIQLSTNALLQVIELSPDVESTDEWVEEMDYRMAMTMGFQVMCRIISADPLGPAALQMECEWVRRAAPSIPNNLSPVTMEVVQAVLHDALYSLVRGEASWLEMEPEWLDNFSITRRLIPEVYGFSVEMAKIMLETVRCLYGSDGRDGREGSERGERGGSSRDRAPLHEDPDRGGRDWAGPSDRDRDRNLDRDRGEANDHVARTDRDRGQSTDRLRSDRHRRLKSLYDTLTNSVLVDIYASAHSPRVQIGDLLYRQALIIIIAMDGFGVPPSDPQIMRGCDAILELYAEAVYGDIYTVRWMLPLLVGGGLAPEDRRPEVQRIFDAMADTVGCHDIDAARLWTEDAWGREHTWRGGGVPLLYT